jgi:hypothetical protein
VAASVSTIKQSNMSGILDALRANDNLASFSKALEGTPWASSAYGGASFSQPSGVYAMGDPVGGMAGGMSAASVRGRRTGSGGGSITLNMPLQVVSASQQEAQRLAQMVMTELRNQTNMSIVGET